MRRRRREKKAKRHLITFRASEDLLERIERRMDELDRPRAYVVRVLLERGLDEDESSEASDSLPAEEQDTTQT